MLQSQDKEGSKKNIWQTFWDKVRRWVFYITFIYALIISGIGLLNYTVLEIEPKQQIVAASFSLILGILLFVWNATNRRAETVIQELRDEIKEKNSASISAIQDMLQETAKLIHSVDRMTDTLNARFLTPHFQPTELTGAQEEEAKSVCVITPDLWWEIESVGYKHTIYKNIAKNTRYWYIIPPDQSNRFKAFLKDLKDQGCNGKEIYMTKIQKDSSLFLHHELLVLNYDFKNDQDVSVILVDPADKRGPQNETEILDLKLSQKATQKMRVSLDELWRNKDWEKISL